VLFAFYAMLSVAIELRGAPFVGWIRDLSRHDPLYITPVLMGLTQFWQMRMTPTTADPVQARMFMMMPVIFMVTSLWFPAGLVLSWFVSNLLAIGQQYLTNRIIGAPPAPPVKPAPAPKIKAPGNGGGAKA
jgi:YidC/Oxa1 family membrane protein insertase